MTFVKVIRSGARDENGELPPEVWDHRTTAPTLNQFDNNSETRATVLAVQGFYWHSSGRSGFGVTNDMSPTLTVGTGIGVPSPPGIHIQTERHQPPLNNEPTDAVRRLTPIECERLMGWPDNWTHTRHDGKQQADSHRYRQIGNGVVSNVTQWIGQRLPHQPEN
jgi:DNA (cytosine-5)-methyltransferase 1